MTIGSHLRSHKVIAYKVKTTETSGDIARGAEREDCPERQSGRGGKNGSDNYKNGGKRQKLGVIRGHQASHEFCGRQNRSRPQAPITLVTLLYATGKNRILCGKRRVCACVCV